MDEIKRMREDARAKLAVALQAVETLSDAIEADEMLGMMWDGSDAAIHLSDAWQHVEAANDSFRYAFRPSALGVV